MSASASAIGPEATFGSALSARTAAGKMTPSADANKTAPIIANPTDTEASKCFFQRADNAKTMAALDIPKPNAVGNSRRTARQSIRHDTADVEVCNVSVIDCMLTLSATESIIGMKNASMVAFSRRCSCEATTSAQTPPPMILAINQTKRSR